MADSFTAKRLRFTFTLGHGQFGADGSDTLMVSEVRSAVHVEYAGGGVMPKASAKIFGMKQDQMNALSTLGQVATTWRRNLVTIEAGEEGGAFSQVFTGVIVNGYGDYAQMPKPPFIVDAAGGFTDQLMPPKNGQTSYVGATDVATMLANLADQCDPPLKFENNGVNRVLTNPYYAGSPRQQIRQIVEDAGIEWNSGEKGILAIWEPGQFRTGMIPLIAPPPEGSMIGYPAFFSQGITVRNIYNPNVRQGGKVQVKSSLPAANQVWGVTRVDYDLEAMMPKGRWDMTIWAAPPGFTIVPT